MPSEPKVGQVWREKTQRIDYSAKRTLRILDIEEPTRLTHQGSGTYEINTIGYEVAVIGGRLYQRAPRRMMVGNLKKNWELVQGI